MKQGDAGRPNSLSCNLLAELAENNLNGYAEKGRHKITESQNVRGWKGPLWVI